MWKCLISKDATAPASAAWFYPFFPMGTLYDFEHRPYAAGNEARFPSTGIARLRQRAPYARSFTFEAARAYRTPSLEQLTAVYGEQASYDLEMAIDLAGTVFDRPDAYAPRYERISQMAPFQRLTLTEYFVDRGQTDAGVKQYEQWLETSDDEVGISNCVQWLLRHYFETGQQEKATALADRAAEAYSYRGLKTKADLLEWRGDV